MRNINKFQPLIRLPLAPGLANCVPMVISAFSRHRRWRLAIQRTDGSAYYSHHCPRSRPVGPVPLYPPGSFKLSPLTGKAAASWLNHTSDGTRTLLVPGTGFGTYSWGDPQDEPMLWLSTTPWAVRDIIPLGGVNSTRWLDAIETQLEQRATPELASTLARAGYGYVLVRNDLPHQASDTPPSTDEVHTALAESGLRRVASFGPLVTGRPTGVQAFLHSPATPGKYPSLEIYALPKPSSRVDSYPAASLAVVSGGPEALPLLAEYSVLANRPTVLAADLAAGKAGEAQLPDGINPTAWFDTDTLARRDEQFGSLHSGDSYLLASGQDAAGESTAPQFRLDVNPNGHQTIAVVSGIKAVTASNYGFVLGTVPAAGPPAAVDGDPTTAWSVSGYPRNGVGQWLQLTFPEPVTTPYISVSILAEAKKRIRITAFKVTTDAGSLTTPVRDTEAPQQIDLPAGATTQVRLTIESVAGGGGQRSFYGPGIREVVVPGVTIAHTVKLPNDATSFFPAGGPPTVSYLFSRDRTDPQSFLDPDVERQINRTFTVQRDAEFTASGTATERNPQLPGTGKGSTVALACGSGPDVQIDGKARYSTYVRGSRSALAAGQPVSLGLCSYGPIKLAAGQHTIRTLPSTAPAAQASIEISTLSLTTGSITVAPNRKVTITHWGDETRDVKLAAGAASILTVHENFNKSWQATANGKRLTAIRIDGWQQGFIVPAGGAVTVHLVNKPSQTYRLGLLISAILVLLLLIAAAWPSRRSKPILPPRSWNLITTRAAALVLACVTTLLVAGPIVTAAVPVLALVVWLIPRIGPPLAVAGISVAGGVTLAHQKAYASSHQGTFSSAAQIAVALAVAATILSLGLRGSRRDFGKEQAADASAAKPDDDGDQHEDFLGIARTQDLANTGEDPEAVA